MQNNHQKTRLTPYKAPFGNYIIMLLMSIIFALQFLGDPNKIYLTGLILKKASFNALLGHFWLHTGLAHMISNLILLSIFGRATCTKIGNAKYILIYFALGSAAAIAHLLLDGRPVIGASGAILGVLGMAVVLNWSKLSALGPWLILIWLALSIASAIAGNTPNAHIAHIGGFIVGMFSAVALIIFKQADHSHTCNSLMQILCPKPLQITAPPPLP